MQHPQTARQEVLSVNTCKIACALLAPAVILLQVCVQHSNQENCKKVPGWLHSALPHVTGSTVLAGKVYTPIQGGPSSGTHHYMH